MCGIVVLKAKYLHLQTGIFPDDWCHCRLNGPLTFCFSEIPKKNRSKYYKVSNVWSVTTKFNPKKLTCFWQFFDDVDCGDGEAWADFWTSDFWINIKTD